MRQNLTRISAFLLLFLTVFATSQRASAQGDAGVIDITAPSASLCAGANDVKAVVTNYGAGPITLMTIGWSVNGVAQTPFNYTNTLLPGDNDTVTVGSFNFPGGSTFTIDAFTADPNGLPDTDASNDSLSKSGFTSALSGTYTIGGTTPDFARFTDAVTALTTYGVCGPVTFNIRPGVDTMQTVIPEIAGADSINNIRFQSESGDSSSVVLTYPTQPSFTPTNYLIQLDGADYLTFHQLTLERTGIEPYGRILEFRNTATHITVSNCHLIGSTTTAVTNSLAALVYSSAGTSSNDSSNVFTNSRFERGTLGIYMNGINTLQLEQDIHITNNTFVDQYSKGIQMSNIGVAIIRNNDITTNSTYSGYAGMYLDRCQRNHVISHNTIIGVPGTGLYMIDCTGLAGIRGIIANNFITVTDSAGISMINGDYQDIVYNSVLVTGPISSYSAIFMRGSGLGKTVKNNIFANIGSGYAYVVTDSAVFGIEASDYNDLYSNGTNVGNYDGTIAADLAAWVAASSKDSNSVSGDPRFISNSDLHATAGICDNAGQPRANVTDDIDGETRSLTTPDIGADEFVAVRRDLGAVALVAPANGDCGSSNAVITVLVTNYGDIAESNFDVTTDLSGGGSGSLTETFTGTLNAGDTDTLFYTGTLNTSAGGAMTFTISTNLSGDDDTSNDTVVVNITLNAEPAAPTATGDSICAGETASLTATVTGTLNWYDAVTGGTLLGTGSPFAVTPSATTTYYVSDSDGTCESSRTAATVTVLPAPSVTLGNDTSIIDGDTFTFDAGPGFFSYLWNTGATTQTITVGTEGCYTVTVTNTSGCTASDEVCLDVVFPTDVAITSIISPADGDCENASANVEIEVSNLGTNDVSNVDVTVDITGFASGTYTANIAGPIVAGTSQTIVLGTINTLGGGTLDITAYHSFNADQDASNDTLRASNDIVVVPPPPTGLGGSRCGPGPIVITAIASDTVYWYDAPTGGNLLFVGNTFSIPFLSATTTYYAQTGNVCPSQSRTPVIATITPLPLVDLGPDVIANDSTILDAGAGFVIYSWSTSETTQTITVYSTGQYIVTVQDNNGCFNSDTIEVTIFTGIEATAYRGVQLFPNPAADRITLDGMTGNDNDLTVRFLDIRGQVVRTDRFRNASNRISRTYDIETLAPGVYFVEMSGDSGRRVFRLIVE